MRKYTSPRENERDSRTVESIYDGHPDFRRTRDSDSRYVTFENPWKLDHDRDHLADSPSIVPSRFMRCARLTGIQALTNRALAYASYISLLHFGKDTFKSFSLELVN